jgi:hypothetical protein
MGILERIEALLERIVGQLENIADATEETQIEETHTPIEPVTPQDEPVEPNVQASGLFDDGGYEWDVRIHASTKTKTAKGVWKKLRGVDPELYNRIISEQTVNPSPEAPLVDKNSGETVTPSAPSAPSAPTPNVSPVEQQKKDAMLAISALTTEQGVDFDLVVSQLPDGVASFDALDSKRYGDVARDMKAWKDWLGLCHDENLLIQELGGDEGIKGMMTIYGFYDGATNSNQIIPSNLNTVHDCLQDYRKKWEAIK